MYIHGRFTDKEIAMKSCYQRFMSTVLFLSSLCCDTSMTCSLDNIEWLKRLPDCVISKYISRPCSKSGWKTSPGLILLSLLHLCSFLQLAMSTSSAWRITSHKASWCRVLQLPWPHTSRCSPKRSKWWPHEQSLETESDENNGTPSQKCNDSTNSFWGMARLRLLLGVTMLRRVKQIWCSSTHSHANQHCSWWNAIKLNVGETEDDSKHRTSVWITAWQLYLYLLYEYNNIHMKYSAPKCIKNFGMQNILY